MLLLAATSLEEWSHLVFFQRIIRRAGGQRPRGCRRDGLGSSGILSSDPTLAITGPGRGVVQGPRQCGANTGDWTDSAEEVGAAIPLGQRFSIGSDCASPCPWGTFVNAPETFLKVISGVTMAVILESTG